MIRIDPPLASVFPALIEVAMGRRPADLIVRGARLANVDTREILPGLDVAVHAGRIALVGRADHCRGAGTEVIEAAGRFLVPGFMDGHIHVESSMLTVAQYAAAVLPRGTTAIFMDPHEIANVLGIEGVRLMIEEGRQLPLRVFATVPSCVPAAPGLEDAGGILEAEEIRAALDWDNVAGLGEMMNFPGVISGDPDVLAKIRACHDAGCPVTGHFALPAADERLSAYVAAGISSCHESTRAEDALAKMRLGMYAMMREGSAWRDLQSVLPSLRGIDPRLALLVSDDTHPDTLSELGHLDHILRRAVAEGLDPLVALQMVTINTADCFGLGRDLGSIAPGKVADFVLLAGELREFRPELVFAAGRLVAREGKLLQELVPFRYPETARHTVHLSRPPRAADFLIGAPSGRAEVRARVIEILPEQAITRAVTAVMRTLDGAVPADPARDLAKLAVIERHRATGTMGLGFVTGFGIRRGAVASTVAHDSHNLLVLGLNDRDMAAAAALVAEAGGGQAAFCDGELLAFLPLPVAGLFSDRPLAEVKSGVSALAMAWRRLGVTIPSPFMTMALLSLPVIPELRLTNRGLIDVIRFTQTDLFPAEAG